MIRDMKLGIQLLKYGHGAKMSFVAGIIMTVFGVLYSILGILARSNFPGGYFILLSALLLVQLLYTISAASLVAASPARKRLQTKVPAMLSTAAMLVGHLINVVSLGIFARVIPRAMGNVCGMIIITALLMGFVMVYAGIVYKLFALGTVVFIGMFAVICGPAFAGGWQITASDFMPLESLWGNFWLAAALGLAVILVCGLLQYLLSLAVYKVPVSKWALGARLRDQM